MTDWVADWLTDWLTDLTGWLAGWLADWLTDWLIDTLSQSEWLTDLANKWNVDAPERLQGNSLNGELEYILLLLAVFSQKNY